VIQSNEHRRSWSRRVEPFSRCWSTSASYHSPPRCSSAVFSPSTSYLHSMRSSRRSGKRQVTISLANRLQLILISRSNTITGPRPWSRSAASRPRLSVPSEGSCDSHLRRHARNSGGADGEWLSATIRDFDGHLEERAHVRLRWPVKVEVARLRPEGLQSARCLTANTSPANSTRRSDDIVAAHKQQVVTKVFKRVERVRLSDGSEAGHERLGHYDHLDGAVLEDACVAQRRCTRINGDVRGACFKNAEDRADRGYGFRRANANAIAGPYRVALKGVADLVSTSPSSRYVTALSAIGYSTDVRPG